MDSMETKNEDNNLIQQEFSTLTQQRLNCQNCAALLVYLPGTRFLVCTYCKFRQAIDNNNNKRFLGEIDYNEFISGGFNESVHQELNIVHCNSCGATPVLKSGVVADSCSFCGNSLVLANGSKAKFLRPQALLPFEVDVKTGLLLFRGWVKKLWFAPRAFLKSAKNDEQLRGVYIPYWTFDSQTSSQYSGRRGVDYQTTETYTDDNGHTRTRTVTETQWSYVSGHVDYFCDDELVIASRSLPSYWAKALEPWDLKKLTLFDERYLSGFYAEAYQLSLTDGYSEAQQGMKEKIHGVICADIGGDHQKVDSVQTTFSGVTFKHILLPVWISSYLYKGKTYSFFINARTGEVQGQRPYSWVKIMFFALCCVAFIVAFLLAVV